MKRVVVTVLVVVCLLTGWWGSLRATHPTMCLAETANVAASFTIRADWFDRGNVRVSAPGTEYADKYACIWNAGAQPNQSEYDLDFPVTADYTFVALYTAEQSRPVDIYLDDQKVHQGFAGVTGSWQTSSATWEPQYALRVTAGRHVVKLVCPGPCMPHICAFRFESPVAFPAGWKLDRPIARQRIAQPGPTLTRPHLVPAVPLLGEPDRPVEIEVVKASDDQELVRATNSELLQGGATAPAMAGPWVARLTVRENGQPAETARFDLSPQRLRDILQHTIELVDDFRTMERVSADFLAAERTEAAARLADVVRLAKEAESGGKEKEIAFAAAYLAAARLEQRVALSNPLLSFDRLLLVKRRAEGNLALPQNWQGNASIPNNTWNNEIAVFSPVRPGGTLTTLYRPDGRKFVGDVDLHFDGDRMLFSSVGSDGHWQVFEIRTDGSGLRQVTPSLGDVDNYDACYLPDGRIVFTSTACIAAVACVNGSSRVATIYRMDADGRNITQLCFDQEHNWCPTMLEDGRVLYLRWEYTDTPHSHDRVLFSMNPDGTAQREFYGSNSYWPNSLFYARPIPGQPGEFAGIVSGHHGVPRMGELVLFDTAKGRREADGAVQRIPGRGQKVEALIEDNLVDASWPKFLHPYPLSEKYFLVAAQPTPQSAWGIYLADVFDNMVLLREEPGYVLFEPVPLRKTPRPPVVPEKVDPTRQDALVYLNDIYAGDGLRGIPRGTVKALRLFSYHYVYPDVGGPQGVVGMEGPWDIKRIVGTVPVEEDGSAVFRIPAKTPIAVQPLDAEGKALQLMRSWFTGMPGEVLSCVGCHEGQNSGPPSKQTMAARRRPSEITPWRGPMRGFNFAREVQPVLDKFCVACHNGQAQPDGSVPADLRGLSQITDYDSAYHHGGRDAGHFSTSYVELHRFVRRPGLESDYHLLTPMEFHADTTQLVQMLKKGHHNVQLDAEAWDRLITWIDLNAPYHGTWTEVAGAERVRGYANRRRELLRLYAGMDDDAEAITATSKQKIKPVMPEPLPERPQVVDCPGWPFDAVEAQRRQAAAGSAARRTIDLGEGVTMELVLIPAGEFVMGSRDGHPDERPQARVKIERPFWMGRLEVTNRQYALFDPAHDSAVESRFGMQFGVRGFYANGPGQPVVRVSWQRAMDFCAWLGRKTGRPFALPTEAEWEYACRAGTATPFFYGDGQSDFSRFANLADATLREFVCHPYIKARQPLPNASKYDDWIPKDTRFRDGGFLSDGVGNYQPNAWWLCDMHGNVAEWTLSAWRPYPYDEHDGRNDPASPHYRVVRGGSWRDRPAWATSAFRLAYRPYQRIYGVGFRVVCAAE